MAGGHSRIGLLAAVSLGIGGMIGAGIFSILGVAATVSGTALPVASSSAAPWRCWNRHVEGLFITAGLSIFFVLTFELGPIAMMASASFLIVYAAVNGAHLRVRHETGAKAWLVVASLVACVIMFVLLMIYVATNAPAAAWIALLATLAGSFLIEVIYRARTGRRFQRLGDQPPAQPSSSSSSASSR